MTPDESGNEDGPVLTRAPSGSRSCWPGADRAVLERIAVALGTGGPESTGSGRWPRSVGRWPRPTGTRCRPCWMPLPGLPHRSRAGRGAQRPGGGSCAVGRGLLGPPGGRALRGRPERRPEPARRAGPASRCGAARGAGPRDSHLAPGGHSAGCHGRVGLDVASGPGRWSNATARRRKAPGCARRCRFCGPRRPVLAVRPALHGSGGGLSPLPATPGRSGAPPLPDAAEAEPRV